MYLQNYTYRFTNFQNATFPVILVILESACYWHIETLKFVLKQETNKLLLLLFVLHHWPWLALFYQEIYLMYVKILLTNYSNKSTLIPFAMQLHQLTSTEDPAHHVLQLKKRKEHNWVYQALSNLKNPYWNKVEKESLRTVCSSLVGFWLTAESGT